MTAQTAFGSTDLQDTDLSTGAPMARLETDEQTARRVADLVADTYGGDEFAVSLSELAPSRWQVAVYFSAPPDQDAFRATVEAAGGKQAAAALSFGRAEAKDWVRESLAGLRPVAAGRFIVHGAHDRSAIAFNRIGIEIEAALAFGTGHHGTTRGCLVALDRLCKAAMARRPRRILDLGTGSGVLAIGAARALRRRVLASDIDADSVRIARENCALNGAKTLVDAVIADGVTAARIKHAGPFDLIFANILLGPLQRLAAPVKALLAPGGRLIISGVLASQAAAAIAAYRPLALERRMIVDGWATLTFTRPLAHNGRCGTPVRRRRFL
jgi:ribosomal protein L11 methyltransferase